MALTTLGKYELLEELGQGGFGTVYRARETSLEIIRAVKVLHPTLMTASDFIDRFRREGKTTAQLDHPHIVPIYELGEEQGYYYLTMKYLPGGSLKDWLEHQGRIPFEQAVEIIQQLAQALEYALEQPEQLIHRDIKPGNILFERQPDDPKGVSVRLSDFGFAKALLGGESSSFSASGGIKGTPAYIAPEIWDDQPASPASDQYSLACVFYEMLTGQVLFSGSTPMALMKNVAAGPKFPETWPPGVPGEVKLVLEQALAAAPAERYPDLAAFGAACAGLLDLQPKIIAALPNTPVEIKPSNLETVENANQNYKQNVGELASPSSLNQTRDSANLHKAKTSFFSTWKLILIGLLGFLMVGIWFGLSLKANRPETITINNPTFTPRLSNTPLITAAITQTQTPVDSLNSKKDNIGKIGIVLPNQDEQRWIQEELRFREALTAAGYEVEILFSQSSSIKERENVEALLTKGIQVLIICSDDSSAAAASVESAKSVGVKVISYDRLIRDTNAVDYYVTFDYIEIGETQAQYLVNKASGTGNPLYLYAGSATDDASFRFFEGAWKVLQPKIADGTFVIKNSREAVALKGKANLTRDEITKIIGQITTNWDFNVAKSRAEANLTIATAADKGNVFILAPNDGTARAIADAFAADKSVTSYIITGQDAEKASIRYIIDGKQSMTVLKDIRTLEADAIEVAILYLENKIPVTTHTYYNGVINVPSKPSALVTVERSNVKRTIIDSGYYPISDFSGLP